MSKEDRYPLLETQLVNAEPYENPNAYCLEGPYRNFRKECPAIFLTVKKLSDAFPKGDFYHHLEDIGYIRNRKKLQTPAVWKCQIDTFGEYAPKFS